MFRWALVAVLCCLVLIAGCDKEQPQEPGAGNGQTQVRTEAPPGMALIRRDPPLFMSNSPVTRREYVNYLRQTGQPIPSRLSDVAAGTGDQPVTGLTRQEAERYATWALKRVPTRQEWQLAGQVVGLSPYPWDETDPQSLGPIYLVQDWMQGTEQEAGALEAKRQLPKHLLADRQDEVAGLRQRLQDLLEQKKQQALEQWQEFKPAFFSRIDRQKELARLQARQQALLRTAEVLQEMALAKGKLAAQIALDEAENADEAVAAYEQQLATWRAEVQQVKQRVEERAEQYRNQVVALTKEFDTYGPDAVRDQYADEQALLDATAEPADTIAAVLDQIDRLRTAIINLEDQSAALKDLPGAAQVDAQAAEIQARIDDFQPDQELQNRISDLKQRIKNFDQAIGRGEFLDEKLIFTELDALVEAEVSQETAKAALNGLRGVFDQIGQPVEGLPTTSAVPPEDAANE